MKKLSVLVMLVLAMCLAAGCGNNQNAEQPSGQADNGEKLCMLEIFDVANDELLTTVDDQRLIEDLLDDVMDDWDEMETESGDEMEADEDIDEKLKYAMFDDNPAGNAAPEYKLVVSQQKTLLAGQDPNEEREYQEILLITTYQGSKYMAVQVSDQVLHGVKLPDDLMTFYCEMDNDFAQKLQKLL